MKKTFYKITNRSSHPSITKNMIRDLKEGNEVRLKLMDAGSFRNLELIHKQILNSSGDGLEVFMYPARDVLHPQGKVDKWIFSTKREKKDKRLQAILSFLSK